MKSILLRVYITVIQYLDQKQLENGFSTLDILVMVHHLGSVQEFQEGSQAEATEEPTTAAIVGGGGSPAIF